MPRELEVDRVTGHVSYSGLLFPDPRDSQGSGIMDTNPTLLIERRKEKSSIMLDWSSKEEDKQEERREQEM